MPTTGNAEPGDGLFAASEDHSYFQTVERTFIALRGAPLTVSPSDWKLVQRWHREGIPLTLVERVLHDVFANRYAQGKTSRVNGLRYLAPAVREAWAHEQALRAPAMEQQTPEIDVTGRLHNLARRLESAHGHGASWAARIRRLEGSAEEIERTLESLELTMVASLAEVVDNAARERIDAELEQTRGTLGERMRDDDLERAVERLRLQLVRRELALPVLSLFSAAAEAGDDEAGDDEAGDDEAGSSSSL